MRAWLLFAAVLIVVDQLTKLMAEGALSLHESVAVLPYFNITLAYNTGAAFSFLADQGGWQRGFFVVLALAVSVFIVVWMRRLPRTARLEGYALASILGGAVGNVIDRILYGHVIDFLDVYYRAESCVALFATVPRLEGVECHWPAFNVADSAITLGALLLIIDAFRSHKASSS